MYDVKYTLIGNPSVGKTCFKNRLVFKDFSEDTQITLGVQYGRFKMVSGGKEISILVQDTAGEERFECITRSYYRDAHAVFLLFDLSDRLSFDKAIKYWAKEIENNCNRNVVKVLVGNKKDLNRQVAIEESQTYARRNLMSYYEISTKTGNNCINLLEEINASVLKKIEKSELPKNLHKDPSKALKKKPDKRSGCSC